MSESFGSLVYDSIELGGITSSPVFKLWRYGRQDLVRAYKQMGNWVLRAEILSDIDSLYSIAQDAENIFLHDKERNESSLIIPMSYSTENIGEIVEKCELVIVMKFDDETPPSYYRCTRPNGETYELSLKQRLICMLDILVYSTYYIITIVTLWMCYYFRSFNSVDYKYNRSLRLKRRLTLIFAYLIGGIQAHICSSRKIIFYNIDNDFILASAIFFSLFIFLHWAGLRQ
ncbi:hypothetical protein RHO12_01660 [Orbus sturtevantii]|uniref:hypothetical protein n=1 Tax=Orbus sturtevantii TaxID=3074109 RepID=UPI00370D761F